MTTEAEQLAGHLADWAIAYRAGTPGTPEFRAGLLAAITPHVERLVTGAVANGLSREQVLARCREILVAETAVVRR